MKTTTSTVTVVREARKAGQESLPDYRHPKSPPQFSTPFPSSHLVLLTAREYLKRRLPRKVRRIITLALICWFKAKRTLDFRATPELEYLELHLTDHCNLNCRGCAHFCPLAAPACADLSQYESDLHRLSQLFRNIRTIRLMGGEPLLHPDAASFVLVTRAAFPRAHIYVATNGILLPQAPQDFWAACRNTKTGIDLTVYPPVDERVAELRALCDDRRVSLRTNAVAREGFYASLNLKGDSDRQRAFGRCRWRIFVPFLQAGRLYVCGRAALVRHFNQRFGCHIPVDAGIDIHTPAATGRGVLRQLDRPIETCKWCTYDRVRFSWSLSNRQLAEWDAATHRTAGQNKRGQSRMAVP